MIKRREPAGTNLGSAEEDVSGKFLGESSENEVREYQDGEKLVLRVDQIMVYDRNPRKTRNPDYENIRSQLLAKGVQEIISVTRRPGVYTDQFMTARGFNTRLAIIKELYKETGEERFAQLECRFKSWQSESTTYVSHMVENEVRGDVLFYDRAASAMELKSILEAEQGATIGTRQLVECLKEQGLQGSSKADITRFEYTIQHLEGCLPRALGFGLGPSQIDAISNLHDIASRLWGQLNVKEGWDELFRGILQKLDGQLERLEDWSHKNLMHEVARELGGNDTREIQLALAKIDYVLETGKLPELQEFNNIFTHSSENTKINSGHKKPVRKGLSEPPIEQKKEGESRLSDSSSEQEGSNAPSSMGQGRDDDPEQESNPSMRGRMLMVDFGGMLLEQLHQQGYVSALRISKAYPFMNDLVQPINNGVGFYLSNIPSYDDCDDSLNNDALMVRDLPWWWLFSVSGQLNLNDASELPQEIINAPIWKLMSAAENNNGFYHFPGFMDVLTKHYPMQPLIPMLHDFYAMTSPSQAIDQAVLIRILAEVKRRCSERPDARHDGYQSIFNLESSWSKEYANDWPDDNDLAQ